MEKENPPPYSAQPPPLGFQVPQHTSPPYQPHSHVPQPEIQTSHVIISQGPTIISFGPNPKHMVCPSCHAEITTQVKTEPNTKTHLFALILCLFQCYCCVCIPYCVDSCQSQNHYCSNCGAYLGTYQN